MKNKAFYIIFILLCLNSMLHAQDINCATSVKESEDLYKNGHYERAISLLDSTLKQCSLSKREKEDAYIILAQANLEKENYTEANRLLIKILNNDPNFKLKENVYQEDFYSYFNRIRIRPMINAGLKLGVNFPSFSIKNVYSVYSTSKYGQAYSIKPGMQYGGFIEWQFANKISIVGEGFFSRMFYSRTIPGTSSDSLMIDYSEALKSVETSIYLKKYFSKKQIKPFVYCGAYFSKLTAATGNIELTYNLKDVITPDIDQYYLSKSNINMLELRNAKRNGMVLGTGISYKFKNFLIFADAGYRFDIGKYLNNISNAHKIEELSYRYYFIDNDVMLRRWDLSFSVSYILKYSVKSK
jgi:tetratricopeptide (TPR) repeat protein